MFPTLQDIGQKVLDDAIDRAEAFDELNRKQKRQVRAIESRDEIRKTPRRGKKSKRRKR